jgi:hypothetical protein
MMALLLASTTLVSAARLHAQTESTIYNFGPTVPYSPAAGLVSDAAGNLYGVTTGHDGVVYKLSQVSGAWQVTILYNFTGGADGGNPLSTPIFDSAGNLYGTAEFGGDFTGPNCSIGCGVVYKLTPTSSGEWQETVLYAFTGGKDGGYPTSGNLVFDKAGNLFGSNVADGVLSTQACSNTGGCGVIFRLSPSASGNWNFKVIHAFFGGWDGVGPAQLIFDSKGNFFGSAAGAWSGFELPSEPGLVFRLTPTTSGPWTDSVVYAFKGSTDGGLPSALTFDSAGNIYGAGADGGILNNCWSGYGPEGCGVVFRISHVGGKWVENTLYAFSGGSDGSQPNGGLVWDNGSLYGTTWSGGGSGGGEGVVYQLTPAPGEQWTERVVQEFTGTNGGIPLSPLLVSGGNIFGTTQSGGANGYGVAFEITP